MARQGHALSGWPVRQSSLQKQRSDLPTLPQVPSGFQGLGTEDSWRPYPLLKQGAWESALLWSLGGPGQLYSASDSEVAQYHESGGSRGTWLCGAGAPGRESEDTGALAQSRSDEATHESQLQAWLDELAGDPNRLRRSGSDVSSGGWLLRKSRPQTWHADFPEIAQPPPVLDLANNKVSLLVAQIEAEIKAEEERKPEALYPHSEAETVVDMFTAEGVPTASHEVRFTTLHWLSVHRKRSHATIMRDRSKHSFLPHA